MKDIKEYTNVVLSQVDMLKRLVHAELQEKPEEVSVEEALSGMFRTEHLERGKLIHELRAKLQSIKAKVKRKTPPVDNLDVGRAQLEKDPDVALQPGTLHYNVSPAELDNWIASFEAYVNNGKGVDR